MAVFERWTVRPCEALDPEPELGGAPFVRLSGEGRFVILGEGPLLVAASPEAARVDFERSGPLPPILPDFLGFVGYEFGHGLEPLLPAPKASAIPIPDFYFAVHRRLRIWDRATGCLHEAQRQLSSEEKLCPRACNLLRPGSFRAGKLAATEDAASFGAKVQHIREEIACGNVYQVNLTRQELWQYEGSLLEFANRLLDQDPAPYSALIADAEFAIISASPEAFLRIHEGQIVTRPIKGTARRGCSPQEDERLAQELLSCAKNRSELAMITDLLRNDLARICLAPSVRVDAFPELESYARVHHLVATVSGRLRPGLGLRELLEATFPGGSITGCPKLAAMALIHELEPQPRSIYTGAIGWFREDLGQMDLSISIRTAWASASELRFGVGGGIVWDSKPEDEYLETVHKGASLTRCLEGSHA